eukprot:scaffold2383_cov111-Alexandrium_tamarense.AAC.7
MGCIGHRRVDSARVDPSISRLSIALPSIVVMSASVITRKYIRQLFAVIRSAFFTESSCDKASISKTSSTRCSFGVHAFSTHILPYNADNLCRRCRSQPSSICRRVVLQSSRNGVQMPEYS